MKLINVNLSRSRFFLETILVGREMPYNLSNYGYFATGSISGVLLDLSISFIILRPFQIVSTFFATELPNLTSISNSSRQRRSQRACSKAAAETWVQGSWWFAHNPEISKGKRRQTFKKNCFSLQNIAKHTRYIPVLWTWITTSSGGTHPKHRSMSGPLEAPFAKLSQMPWLEAEHNKTQHGRVGNWLEAVLFKWCSSLHHPCTHIIHIIINW